MREAGELRIGNEADRVTVASILYKNGYSVKPGRRRKDGRSYEYFVAYEKVEYEDQTKAGG